MTGRTGTTATDTQGSFSMPGTLGFVGEMKPVYMMWFDDNPKTPVADKVSAAVAAYVRHFKAQPNVVLVNELDKAAPAPKGIAVKAESFVRPNNFWVGLQ